MGLVEGSTFEVGSWFRQEVENWRGKNLLETAMFL